MNQKISADTYDRGIIPAETAARMKREGASYNLRNNGDSITCVYTVAL